MIFRKKYSNVFIATLWVLAGMNCAFGMQNPVGEQKNEQDNQNSKKSVLQLRLDEAWEKLDEQYFSSKKQENGEKTEKKLAVVFDIDGTVLDPSKITKKIKVTSEDGFGQVDFCKPMPYMLDFYKKLLAKNVTIFFITVRPEKSCEAYDYNNVHDLTEQNLMQVGFEGFKKIYCMPLKTWNKTLKQKGDGARQTFAAHWKELKRKEIAKDYEIILTVDDVKENLTGKYLGHTLLVPSEY